MLCLILTHEQLVAAIYAEQNVEVLPINGHDAVDFAGKSAVEVLKSQLRPVAKAFRQQAEISASAPIPIALAFAVGTSHKDGASITAADIQSIFQSESAYDLLQIEPLPLSFLRGANGNPKLADERCVVLEAVDDHLTLCYCNIAAGKLNGSTQGDDSFRYVTYREIGREAALHQMLEEMSRLFGQVGLEVDKAGRDALRKQLGPVLHKRPSDRTYTLKRNQGPVKVQGEVQLSARRHEELAASNVAGLREPLNAGKLDALGVQRVVLMGSFLDNKIVRDYLTKDLALGNRVLAPKTGNEPVLAAVKGIALKAQEVAKIREAEVKRRAEEAARREALEREQQLRAERERLMADIRQTSVNPAEQATYEEQFVARGAQLNIPKEVIVWNIQEALSSASLRQLAKQTPTYAGPTQLVRAATAEQELPNLKELFKIQGVLMDPEFVTKKAVVRGRGSEVTLRVLEPMAMGDPLKVKQFEHLYQKELSYYGQLSEIQESVEGRFYSRPFIARHTLKEYFRKSGLDQKSQLSQFSSKELRFVLSLFEAVRDLPVSHANLSEYTILIHQEGLLRRNIEIKFVGFTSEDCSTEEMESQVHETLGRLFKRGVYEEIRKQIQL